jgi:SNF2 family DNA or RNA helicase
MTKDFELGEHQLKAVNFNLANNSDIISYGTGTGKSVIMLASTAAMIHEKQVEKGLICATKASINEVQKDCRNFFNTDMAHITNTFELENFYKSKKNIGILRYEYFKNIDSSEFYELLKKYDTYMAFDEAQRLKGSATKAHNYVKAIRPQIKKFNLVTATPLMSSLDDLHSLMTLTDPRALGSYDEFSDKYYVKELGPKYQPKRSTCPTHGNRLEFSHHAFRCPAVYYNYSNNPPTIEKCKYSINVGSKYNVVELKNLDELSSIMQKYMISYYPVQDINFIVEEAYLPDFNEYNSIVQDIANNNETAYSARMVELRHYVNGTVEKLTAFAKTLSKVIHKGAIVYCNYHKSVDLIASLLDANKIDFKIISGTVEQQERLLAKDWFTGDSSNKVLIITQAGGASLNLQSTDSLIFYDIPNSGGDFIQVMGRIVRLFSIFKHFYVYFIQVKGTVDEYRYECVFKLRQAFQQIMQYQYIPEGIMQSFSSYEVQRLKQEYLWRRNQITKNMYYN